MSYGVDYIDYVKDEDLMFIYNGINMKMGYVINAKFRMKLLLEVPAEVTCDINITIMMAVMVKITIAVLMYL